MASESPPRGRIKSDRTLFRIVERLQVSGEAGVTELAEQVGHSKSTVHKHLQSLSEAGYVVKERDKYRLGLKFLSVGGAVRDRNRLCLLARDHLKELASNTDRMVAFALKERHYGYLVRCENEKYMIQRSIPLGTRFPLHQNSAGKAILSELDGAQVEEILDTVGLPSATPNTITDREQLLAELDAVRERGYAVNLQERVDGFWGVSAPVRDPDHGHVGAFSVAGPADSSTDIDSIEDRYVDSVVRTANELRMNLRYG